MAPIEGPPISGKDISNVLSGTDLHHGGIRIGSAALAIVGGIMMLSSSSDADLQSNAASQKSESLLNKDTIWMPTVELAEETMRQLETGSGYSVSITPGVKPLPSIKSREATYNMHNWFVPIGDWYNMDTSLFSYSGQPQSSVVLEIALLSYELSYGRFNVQVAMKLIDPASGIVVGNARSYSHSQVDDIEKLFEGDASGFKQMFRRTTKPLVTDCIEILGLRKT
jgi:hypothetical protein